VIVTKARIAELFNEQVKRVLALQYPQKAGMRTVDFIETINPLWDQIGQLEESMEMESSHLPVALVVPFSLVSVRDQVQSILSRDGNIQKFSSVSDEDLSDFHGFHGTEHKNKPYLIFNARIDGNATPAEGHAITVAAMDISDWYFTFSVTNRFPLSAEEGLALFTHFEIGLGLYGFAFLGSRASGRRVPNLVETDMVIELRADEQSLYENAMFWGAVSCKKRIYSR